MFMLCDNNQHFNKFGERVGGREKKRLLAFPFFLTACLPPTRFSKYEQKKLFNLIEISSRLSAPTFSGSFYLKVKGETSPRFSPTNTVISSAPLFLREFHICITLAESMSARFFLYTREKKSEKLF